MQEPIINPHDVYEYMIRYGKDPRSRYDSSVDGYILKRQIAEVGPSALEIASSLYENSDSEIRQRTITGLSELGEPSIVLLTKALADTDIEVRKKAVSELSDIGESALEAFAEAFNDKDADVRYTVIDKLPGYKEATVILTKAIDDPNVEVRIRAVEVAMYRVGLSAVGPVLLATEDTIGKIATLALYSLVEREEYRNWKGVWDLYFPTETLDSILSIVMDELIIRKSGRADGLFNSKTVASILQALIPQNPAFRATIYKKLCEIAYTYKDGVRQRAVAVARRMGAEEFASYVRNASDKNPQEATKIMRELGGSEATAFFTEAQSQTLAEYRAPLIELENMARQRWEELTIEAKRSSAASKWMSVGVFVVGTGIVIWAFVLLSLSDEPWQQLVAALAGVGSFLAMYSQRFWKEPVEQIQRFSAQQACLQVAFIGFMNRVAQVRLLFEGAYAKDNLSSEMVANYQKWLEDATEHAWKQLAGTNTSLPEPSPTLERQS